MDERTLKTFNTISDLLSILKNEFPRNKPLALYDRLVGKTQIRNHEAIKKHVGIFKEWCQEHQEHIINDTPLPQNTRISYSDRINVSIAFFIKQSAPHLKDKINHYLHTICALQIPDEKILSSLEEKIQTLKIDNTTKEGAFLGEIMGDVKSAVENSSGDNPMAAIGGLLSGGFIQKMTAGLTQSIGSGEMDMGKLFGVLQGAMAEMGNQINQQEPPKIEEIIDEDEIINENKDEDEPPLETTPLKEKKEEDEKVKENEIPNELVDESDIELLD